MPTPRPLNLHEALKLYGVLANYLPEDIDNITDTLAFIGKIVDNIIKSGRARDFVIAMEIMYKMSASEILKLDVNEAVDIFTLGLIENRILDLHEFCKRLNYHARS